jgi:hypothetical protein
MCQCDIWYIDVKACFGVGLYETSGMKEEGIVKTAVSKFVVVWFLLYICSKHYKSSLSIISIMYGKMRCHGRMWI